MEASETSDNDFSEETSIVLGGMLLVLWLEFCWELYLSLRQHRVCVNTLQLPKELEKVMTQETFNKARLYAMDKHWFSFYKDIFNIILSSLTVYYGFYHYFWALAADLCPWQNEIAQSCVWILLLNTFSTIIGLPFTLYYTFILEEKWGFNKQTASFFTVDKIKSFILVQLLSVPISAFAIFIVQVGGTHFYFYLWLMSGILFLVLYTIYPSYIAPLFDKYEPLPEGPLRTSIETLAAELKFPLGQLYVVEGSKRSAHSNAYFYGIFVKRIVLFDTLIEDSAKGSGCTDEEVLAVLCHELGHWSLGHVTKNLIIYQLNLLLMFAAFGFMFGYAPLYTALGFPVGTRPVLIGLIAVLQFVLAPYNALLSFIMTLMSRRFEFQADAYACEKGKSKLLQLALVKLTKDNLSFPVYDPLYSTWHLTHPPLLERIAALKKQEHTNVVVESAKDK